MDSSYGSGRSSIYRAFYLNRIAQLSDKIPQLC